MQVPMFPFICVMGTAPLLLKTLHPLLHSFAALCTSSSLHQGALCSVMKDTGMPTAHSLCNPLLQCSVLELLFCSLLSPGSRAAISLCLFSVLSMLRPQISLQAGNQSGYRLLLSIWFFQSQGFSVSENTISYIILSFSCYGRGTHGLLLFYLILTKVHTYLYLW